MGEAGSEELNNIVTAAREGHYQKACSLQFAASHKGQEPSTGIINHPNQFYKESVHGPPGSGAAGSQNKTQHKTHKAHLYLEKPHGSNCRVKFCLCILSSNIVFFYIFITL